MPVLMPGYDFTKNRDSADEKGDMQQSTAAVVDGALPAWVNQSTAAVVDQSTAAVVDANPVCGLRPRHDGRRHHPPRGSEGNDPSAQGVQRRWQRIHLGRDSRHYKAVNDNAKVLNMSFSFANSSKELSSAISFANKNNVIVVAAVGNDGPADNRVSGRLLRSRHGRRVDSQQRCAIVVLELRLDGVWSRARRGRRYDISVWHVRGGLGHLLQRALCRRAQPPYCWT